MSSTISRRQLAAALGAALPVTAQNAAPAAGPTAELEKAIAANQANAKKLRDFVVAQSTEPAFVFKP